MVLGRKGKCQRPTATGGQGLNLVAQTSVAWGQRQRATGKTVWAEIDLTHYAKR